MIPTEEKEAIYCEYSPKVKRYISSHLFASQDIEDLTNDVFVKVYEKWESFDKTKSSVGTWIYIITRNTVIDYFRTGKSIEELPEMLANEDNIEEELVQKELLNELAVALEGMDERLRDLLILRYYSRLSLKAIANQMGISYSYAKVLHNAGITALKEKLHI